LAHWKSFAAIAAVTLLAAGPAAIAQTAPAAKPPARNTKPYPAEFRTNFMPACMKDDVLNEAQCGCIHRNIEREFTEAEYIELDKAAMEGKEHPSNGRLKEIVVACYTNPAY
jgi:hypothetical protein